MGAPLKQLVQQYMGRAQQNPGARREIFQEAAQAFMGLAQDPRNGRASSQLAKIGLDFAGAAHREQPLVIDDFTDLLQETKDSWDQVDDDPMNLVARRRQVHEERTVRPPGSVSIAPESFNRDATLGRSAVIQFDPSPEQIRQGILQSQNVAFWQGTKKEAQAMTVDVGLGFNPLDSAPPESIPGTISIRAFGEVEYGSDGNRTKVKFDLGLGTRFTVVGNYIAVTVGADPPDATLVPGGTLPATAGASIGAFAAPTQGPIIRTVYVDDLAATTPLLRIPLKAVQLLPIMSTLAPGESLSVSWFTYGGDLAGLTTYTQSATAWMQPVPIPGDVAQFTVTTSVGGKYFRLPFQLAM